MKNDKENQLIDIYRTMLTSRRLDEKMLVLLRQGKSFFHIGAAGHEAAQVGAAMAFKPGYDWSYPYYRDQAFVLQWGVTPKEILLNFLARADDPSSGGRQLPQHYGHKDLRIVSQSSPTGTQYLQAVGTAMGSKKDGTDQVVYVSSGEGATSQGDFYEAINWATRDLLPVVFFIQDNKYAISVPNDQQTVGRSVYDMVMGYENLHRHSINGLDPLECYEVTKHCVENARTGKGPSLIVAHTVRLFSHSSSDDQRKYRDSQELDFEKSQDPIESMKHFFINEKILKTDELDELENAVKKDIDTAAEEALHSPLPDTKTVKRFIFSESNIDYDDKVKSVSEKPVVMVDAVNHALREELARDDNMLIYGQDVAGDKGGVFTVTKGLTKDFGIERVFNAPLAESSIIGTAIGLALYGYRPVVEIQFGDYIWTAMMQIRNELSTMHWRSNGTFTAPVTVRVPVGGYIHGGLCHSQNIEGFFAHIPGLVICYPSNAADAKGLLKMAIRSDDPVLFLEHKGLYRQSHAMSPEPDQDYTIPFGKAVVKKQGKDATIITYGAMVQRSIEVAQKMSKQGIDIEVIDLRTIVPLDMDTILKSVNKTSRILVLHEDTLTGGFGAEISARISESAFEFLDAPVLRVAASDTPVPYNWDLEAAVLPQNDDIEQAVQKLVTF